jgi:malonyl-CoA/methylmalonyl-CoA synthetase
MDFPFRDPSAWIECAAREQPQRTFLKTPAGAELSYAGLRDRSGRFAQALMRRGVEAGDRVAVQVDKSADAVLLYIACLRAGAVFVPINIANTPNEVEYFLCDSQPRVAIVRPSDLGMLRAAASRAAVPWLETLGDDGDGTLHELAAGTGGERAMPDNLDPSAPAAIVYTSGTTGRSKGAVISRGNLASNAETLVAAWQFTNRDVLLHALPLFHIHGLFAAINTVLASASSLLLLPRFDADAVLDQLRQATVFMGVPTYYTRMLQLPQLDRNAAAGMRLFVSGSAPLLAETHGEFLRRTGHAILERYGMTETLMNTSNPYIGVRRPGSVGPPLPGVKIRTVDAATGAIESGADVTGALEIRGPNVFCGYWRDPEKTRSEFTADGWFKTGDLGRVDRDGYVYIVGRAKDLVISGGYNVYPKEVETELDAVPGVLESAVFGVPHPDFGEGVTAVIVLQAGAVISESGIIDSLAGRLARYKVPKRILIVDELPRNAMGKVQKNLLRSAYALLYGPYKF